jgi:hypothetical protein
MYNRTLIGENITSLQTLMHENITNYNLHNQNMPVRSTEEQYLMKIGFYMQTNSCTIHLKIQKHINVGNQDCFHFYNLNLYYR